MALTRYPNEHFYDNGKLNLEKALAAYGELMRHHNYSLTEAMLKHPAMWISDFGMGEFVNVGVGGVCFVNDREHGGYFSHSIYLLPGQMLAEHWHVSAEGMPPKHETWVCLHGSVWTAARGGDRSKVPFKIPESQESTLLCFDTKKLEVGDFDVQRGLEEPHYFVAGPEGAIVQEFASFHSGEGFRFSNPNVNLS